MEFIGPESNNAEYEFISINKMKNMAKNNENPPEGFMSHTSWKVLAEYFRSL
jgi:3'-phosphoadenosine 5'-phosphosulfate synthase